MINRAVLVGRLTRDPELRYTSSGAAVVSFTGAVNRQFTNSQGEREADFINCVMWRKAAENFANFTRKGSLVGIDGRIQTRSYSERRQENEGFNNGQSAPSQSSAGNPFDSGQANNNGAASQPNNSNPNDPFANGGQSIDISDDDLPF